MLPYLKSTEVANPKFYSSPWPYANSDMKIATVYGNGTYSFRTSDGIIYTVWIADPSGGNSKGTFNPIATVYVDINGTKGPNTYGKDIFLIGIDVAKNKVIGWCSGYSSITTINKNCSQNGNRRCCADKIIIDGWQIKDNYPW
jgi:hypothetical protein